MLASSFCGVELRGRHDRISTAVGFRSKTASVPSGCDQDYRIYVGPMQETVFSSSWDAYKILEARIC